MGTEKYNGWTNYETWNVNLWMTNEEPLYRLLSEQRGTFTPESAKALFLECFPSGTPDFKGLGRGRGVRRVNWVEIAEAWNEE